MYIIDLYIAYLVGTYYKTLVVIKDWGYLVFNTVFTISIINM